MEVLVLDENFTHLKIFDTFESLLWTERYGTYGEFEYYTYSDSDILNYIKRGYYVKLFGSDTVMFVEEIKAETKFDEGKHITITGKSLESILHRRIIWNFVNFGEADSNLGNLQQDIKLLINDNIIAPEDSARRIPNFIFEDSTDPAITSLTITAQYAGENLGEVIDEICSTYSIGYRITLNDNNQFVFKLYSGANRSFNQTVNPPVIFSSEFDNLSDTNYIESDAALKNVSMIIGEKSDGTSVKRVVGEETGLTRREIYTDATDIQDTYTEEEGGESVEHQLTPEEFNALLDQRGADDLYENRSTLGFEGSIEPVQGFVYGTDFFIGDVLQVETDFGLRFLVRVTEFVSSQDSAGIQFTPTFTILDYVE